MFFRVIPSLTTISDVFSISNSCKQLFFMKQQLSMTISDCCNGRCKPLIINDFPSKNGKNGKEAQSCPLDGQATIVDEGMVPVLDLKVSVCENQLIHEYYEKPCAAKMVIPRSSAHSRKIKMAVLVEEGLRRLRNYSRGLEWERSRAEGER